MVLRCLGRPGSAVKNTTMYKNQEAQAPLRDGSDFRVHGALLRDNGQYHCKADKESCCSVVSNTVEIQVQGKARVISKTGSSQGSLQLGPGRVWRVPMTLGAVLPGTRGKVVPGLSCLGRSTRSVEGEFRFPPEQSQPHFSGDCCDPSL